MRRLLLFILLPWSIFGQTVNFPNKVAYTPGGNSGELQFNNGGAFGGIINAETDGTNITLVEQSTTTTASSSNVNMYASGTAPYGLSWDVVGLPPYGFQTSFSSAFRSEMICTGLGANTYGMTTSSTSPGGTTFKTPSAGSAKGMIPTVRYTTGTGVMANANIRVQPSQLYIGTSTYGGFSAQIAAGTDTDPANQTVMIGLLGSAVPSTTTAPTTTTDCVGVGYAAGESNYSLIHNDASGNTTKTDLGSNFPTSIAGNAFLRIDLQAKPGAGTVLYRISNVTNDAVATGTISTNLPAADVALFPIVWIYNGASMANCAIVVERLFTESY